MKGNNDLPIYAIKFKRFRLSKGLTQEGMGKILGLSMMTIAAYEQGIRRPKDKTMHVMHKKLGLDIYDIFFNEELEELPCQK